MNNKSKWLYLSTILILVLVILGLFFHESSPLQAESLVNNFNLGYEQGFYAGYNRGYNNHIEYRDIVHYIDREITKEVTVEKPIELRHFQSLDELEQWLSGVSIFASDCDDFAIELQRTALEDGYIVSFEVIFPEEYNALFEQKRLPSSTVHAVNLAIIGNEVYYIEPQTHEVVFAADLD